MAVTDDVPAAVGPAGATAARVGALEAPEMLVGVAVDVGAARVGVIVAVGAVVGVEAIVAVGAWVGAGVGSWVGAAIDACRRAAQCATGPIPRAAARWGRATRRRARARLGVRL